MRSSMMLVTAAMLVAGCGERAAEAPPAQDVAPAAPAPAAAPSSALPSAQPVADPPEEASDLIQSEAKSPIPIAFHGRWGLVANDCDPARADAKGLMTVAGDRLTFYESRGVPARIQVTSPTELSGSFAFTGEGQEWTRRMVLTLTDGGDKLIRVEQEPAMTLSYARCPA